MTLRVVEVLGDVSLQDLGRTGFRRFGVPPGGAFDRCAHTQCNALLSNALYAATLELALATLTVEVLEPGNVAITGAHSSVEINGKRSDSPVALSLAAGDLLKIEPPEFGVRVYFGISGGIAGAVVLGSRSGWRPALGDVLRSCGEAPADLPGVPVQPSMPRYTIRLTPGPQAEMFSLDLLSEGSYQVTRYLDRTGIRLRGTPLGPAPEIVSEPAFFGSVQVSRDGQPILLGPDGPTIGGYPKVAQVVDDDLDALAQLGQGDDVWFEWSRR